MLASSVTGHLARGAAVEPRLCACVLAKSLALSGGRRGGVTVFSCLLPFGTTVGRFRGRGLLYFGRFLSTCGKEGLVIHRGEKMRWEFFATG